MREKYGAIWLGHIVTVALAMTAESASGHTAPVSMKGLSGLFELRKKYLGGA